LPESTNEQAKLLTELAVAGGLVTQEQADDALAVLAKVRELGVPEELGHILIKKGYLSEEQLRSLENRLGQQQPARVGGFEIMSRIGRGGMGAVYKARQVSMDRLVALKILPPTLAKDKEFIERFFREARALAKMNHPNIVQGIDVGVADKYYYFAMEYVDGETVQSILTRSGAIPEKQALHIAQQVAQALHHAFRNGLVHRDIKPENIIVTSGGVAKLCDLGLAKSLAGDSSMTQTGLAVGTPHYISPEQAQGEKDVDIRADIYSLGASLYHMICGQTPYAGSSAAVVMTRHLNDDVPNPRDVRPDLSPGIARLIERMMAKSREDRYQTPEALIKDIELVLAGKTPGAVALATGRSVVRAPAVVRPSARHRPGERTARLQAVRSGRTRLPALAGAAALALAGLVVIVFLLAGADNGERPLPPPPAGNSGSTVDDGTGSTGSGSGSGPGTDGPSADSREAKIQGRLAEIESYWEKNPADFKGVHDRLRFLKDSAAGTIMALKIQSRMDEVMAARTKFNQDELDKALAAARQLEAQGKYGDALKAFGALPLSPELLAAATEEQNAIRRRAMEKFQQIKDAAGKKLGPARYEEGRRGDLDGALAELARAASMGLAEVDEAAGVEAGRLRTEHATRLADLERRLAESRNRELAEKRASFVTQRDELLARAAQVNPRTRQYPFAEAAEAARRQLLRAEFKPFEEEAARLERDLRELAAFQSGLGPSVTGRTGSKVKLRTRSGVEEGEIAGADDKMVSLKRGLGAIGVYYDTIDARDLVSLAGGDAAAPGGAYMAGVLAVFAGRAAEAVDPLEVAEKSAKHRADACYYLVAAREARRALRETEAERELAECRAAMAKMGASAPKGDARWAELLERLKKLAKDYADTDVVKRNL
jgi:serine/threonine-protein kinase